MNQTGNKSFITRIVEFFKRHYISGNLILIIVTGCILVALTFFSIDIYTQHGEEEEVPNLSGMDEESATKLLAGRGLQCEVVDSVFRQNAGKGLIVEQYPLAGSMVKSGRKIYLTINAKSEQMVALPPAKDLSVRQAKVLLESADFKIDTILYKPSAYKDLVLSVYCNGKEVVEGDRLPINSRLEIWAGSGYEYDIPQDSIFEELSDETPESSYEEEYGNEAETINGNDYSMEEEILF